MKIKGFKTLDEFIKFNFYNNFSKKVIFLKLSPDIAKLSGTISDTQKEINSKCLDELFITYSVKEDPSNRELIIPQNIPVFYYGGHGENARNYIKQLNINTKNMYNLPDEMKKSGDKVTFSKLFIDKEWLPKTVFSKENAIKELKFPVIAKVADGHSGIGIENFKSITKLRKSNKKYDLYSDFIDFDREFRIMFIKDKYFMVNERIPKIDDNKTIRNKKPEESVSFMYVFTDLNKIPKEWLNQIENIGKEIREKVKLDIWSLDVVMDKQRKLWVLEINSATGLGSAKMVAVYEEIYKDFYKKELPTWYKEKLLKEYVSQSHIDYYSNHEKEIEKCPWAIDYKTLKQNYKK